MTDFSKQPQLDVFKSYLVKGANFRPVYEFPLIKRTDFKPKKALPFDKASTSKDFEQWIYFYIHDRNFERIWNNPKQYFCVLKRFDGVITPDFSLYRELPLAMQIWNTYRNRALAYWLQSNDINIIPNIRWGDERTYTFAFEGIEKGGTVATSTNGCIRNKYNRSFFVNGLAKMVETLRPNTIINYSSTPKDIFDQYTKEGIEVICIPNYVATIRKAEARFQILAVGVLTVPFNRCLEKVLGREPL